MRQGKVLKKLYLRHIKTYNLIEVPLWIGIMNPQLSRKIDKAFINTTYSNKNSLFDSDSCIKRLIL